MMTPGFTWETGQTLVVTVKKKKDEKTFDKGKPDWVYLDATVPWPREGRPIDWIALNAAVNSTAHLEGDQLVAVGNSTEGALLHWLFDNGIMYQKLPLLACQS